MYLRERQLNENIPNKEIKKEAKSSRGRSGGIGGGRGTREGK